MTTVIGERGQLVIPKEIRKSCGIAAGDDFEVSVDESDPNLIFLRRINPKANAGLVDHLLNCPYKGPLEFPIRKQAAMRRVHL